jgi:hypothetical protein
MKANNFIYKSAAVGISFIVVGAIYSDNVRLATILISIGGILLLMAVWSMVRLTMYHRREYRRNLSSIHFHSSIQPVSVPSYTKKLEGTDTYVVVFPTMQ